jgi:sorbitol-specific phosphotransferase system component IIA
VKKIELKIPQNYPAVFNVSCPKKYKKIGFTEKSDNLIIIFDEESAEENNKKICLIKNGQKLQKKLTRLGEIKINQETVIIAIN